VEIQTAVRGVANDVSEFKDRVLHQLWGTLHLSLQATVLS
jgi:hypothetical protein